MKLTRRKLAAVLASAQPWPLRKPHSRPADDLLRPRATACWPTPPRSLNPAIPMATEPAFQFKA